MTDFKGLFSSRAVWAGIVGFMAVVLDLFGVSLGADFSEDQVVDAILKVVQAISFLAGIAFRVVATKRIA